MQHKLDAESLSMIIKQKQTRVLDGWATGNGGPIPKYKLDTGNGSFHSIMYVAEGKFRDTHLVTV